MIAPEPLRRRYARVFSGIPHFAFLAIAPLYFNPTAYEVIYGMDDHARRAEVRAGLRSGMEMQAFDRIVADRLCSVARLFGQYATLWQQEPPLGRVGLVVLYFNPEIVEVIERPWGPPTMAVVYKSEVEEYAAMVVA